MIIEIIITTDIKKDFKKYFFKLTGEGVFLFEDDLNNNHILRLKTLDLNIIEHLEDEKRKGEMVTFQVILHQNDGKIYKFKKNHDAFGLFELDDY